MIKIPESEISGNTLSEAGGTIRKKSSPVDHHPYFIWINVFTPAGISFRFLKDPHPVTGYSANEIKDIGSVVHEADRGNFKKVIDEMIADSTKTGMTREYRITRRDGTVCWVHEFIKTERFKSGKIKAVSGFVSDITKIKNDHHLLLSDLDEQKELNASKDKFISILSHDLRAPFTSILGFAEILINEPHLSVRERSEYLQYIHESSQHQLQLINYLLDWSRLQTGRIKLDMERLNLSMVIFNSVSSLTGNAIRKGVEIRADVSEKLNVTADERLLSQVVTNLLSNAVKFSDADSKVEISADVFNEDFVEIVIKDCGIGIPDSHKDKLFKFELMFTTEGTKGEKGTGLGLPLVKEIIDKHGGTIWFYSEEGNGSEFHFTIPLYKNSIMIISDQKDETSRISGIIADELPYYSIKIVKNSFEAMKGVLGDIPSLIILRHDMPLMNGVQFIENLKNEVKHFHIPFIIILDNLQKDIQREYFNLGAAAVVPGPADAGLLLRHIESALQI